MKQLPRLFLIWILLASGVAQAKKISLSDLKTGDLLLQSVPCYLCTLIEKEENSRYSHVGVVLKNASSMEVLQAWQSVTRTSLESFFKLRRKGTLTLVLRPLDKTKTLNRKKVDEVFRQEFEGLRYDEAFLWDNRDERGEKLYCSEFIAKFMNRFLRTPLSPKAMHFTSNRAAWIQYFNGTPPDGAPGISPGDLERSTLFQTIGEI